jgi:hypothetical protein
MLMTALTPGLIRNSGKDFMLEAIDVLKGVRLASFFLSLSYFSAPESSG